MKVLHMKEYSIKKKINKIRPAGVPVKIKLETSNVFGLNRSRMVDEDNGMRHNASQMIQIQDDISNQSYR